MHEQIAKRAGGSGYVLREVDVALLTVLYYAPIVHVVMLAAAAAGGDAAGRHTQTELRIGVRLVFPIAVGTLQVIGGKASVRGVVQRLVAHDDTVVDTNDVIGTLFVGCLLLLGGKPLVIRENNVVDAPAERLADLAEHASRVRIHGSGQRLIEERGILEGKVTRLAAILALAGAGD